MAASRQNQPSFNFLTGDSPPRQPLRETFKQSLNVRSDANNESLRAQINTLQYELDTFRQEREFKKLEYEGEVREAERRADADYKRAQACISQPAGSNFFLTALIGHRGRAQCSSAKVR